LFDSENLGVTHIRRKLGVARVAYVKRLVYLHTESECCSVLQCVAVCCSVLQCVAVCCSVIQRISVFVYVKTGSSVYIYRYRREGAQIKWHSIVTRMKEQDLVRGGGYANNGHCR